MRAFQLLSHERSPELIEIIEPRPGRGEVLLEILACGLNFADLLMAKGTYQETPSAPFTLGLEVCGRVLEQGEGVVFPPVGARVALVAGSGGLAERGVFAASACRIVPDSMPDEVAAGFQIAYGTSHLALTRRAQLRAGERLVVLGAAGGVGLTAVEIGKALGAELIAVARGAKKLGIAKEAGADHLIDAEADLVAAIQAIGGADVVYDPVGGAAFEAALRACNREARILSIGFASGDVPKIPANILMVKNVTVIGFYWGGYMKFAPDALLDSLSEVMSWYAEGRLKPHISHVLPLERAREALALLADRKATGKVVVVPK